VEAVDPAVTLVLVQRRSPGGAVSWATLGLLAVAERLGTPVAVLCGLPSADDVDLLGRYGAERIMAVTAPGNLTAGSEAGYEGFEADAIVELARRLTPNAILIAAGREGQVTAARVAVRLESGIITDATDLRQSPDGLLAVQETLGGTHLVESVVGHGTAVITMRAAAVAALPVARSITSRLIVEHIHLDSPSMVPGPRLLSRTPKRATTRSPLAEADVVVAGGRGVGSAEGFGLLARLADALGGCLGGTHTAEELGWCPTHARISLPGTQIRPRLYLATGVSGSVRHRAAIRGSKTVVAVDRDPAAPIFRVADFGVIGDLQQVLPALLEEIRQRRAGNPPDNLTADPPEDPTGPSDLSVEA